MIKHVVLLGDSTLDNRAYVNGGPSVEDNLRVALPGERVTLLAVDGSMIDDVHDQLKRVPADTTHLVLSVGGNDAIDQSTLLYERVDSSAMTLSRLAGAAEAFEARYRTLADALIAKHLPLAICTIYLPRFADPYEQRLSVTALTVFNDAILRVGFEHGLPVIDLRLTCTADADYANAIEPSAVGGGKIARVIAKVVNRREPDPGVASVYCEGV